MKRITVELTEEAEKAFNEIMYSLPKNTDGSGTCTQSQAVSYALECVGLFEKTKETDIISFLNEAMIREAPSCSICDDKGIIPIGNNTSVYCNECTIGTLSLLKTDNVMGTVEYDPNTKELNIITKTEKD